MISIKTIHIEIYNIENNFMRILTIILVIIFLIACSKNEQSVMNSERAKLFVSGTKTSTPASAVVAVPASDLIASMKADVPLEVIGVYIDTTSFPNLHPEIILYKQDGQLGGTYTNGYPNSENKKGVFWGPSPLENISLALSGDISFSVPWDMGNPQVGFEKKHHYFSGQIHNDIIQGSFTSDWPSLTPPPIKASKKTSADMEQDVLEYVLKKKRSASENIQKINEILNCQEVRNRLPKEELEIIGFWSEYESNGVHESGYDIAIFRLGKALHGWIEDYSGLIGDGGIRYIIGDIRLSDEKLNFKMQNVEYEGFLKNSQLELHSFGEVELLKKTKFPTVEWIWKQYQALNIKCE
jgi:hypothetical protein